MLVVYNFLLLVLLPLWWPWMLLRSNKRKEQVDWNERTGQIKIAIQPGKTRIWFHSVSVGEVLACVPILKALRKEIPDLELILSVTTSSGHETARGLPEGTYDHLVYFPIDIPRFVLNSLITAKPHMVVSMETELWMNWFSIARTMGIGTCVVNGRISDRAFKRMINVRPFYRALLKNVDLVLTQTERDAKRFEELGASKPVAVGNCKFDQAVPDVPLSREEIRAQFEIPADALVLVIGSTRSELEENLVIDAIKNSQFSDCYVIHAPRHVERAEALGQAVAEKLSKPAFRSKGEMGRYLILDTYGELASAYAAADVAIVGGGFDDLGGQNILQPLALGLPVLHGPNMFNFRDIADLSVRADASRICATAEELTRALDELLGDPHEREVMGFEAKKLVESQVGSSQRYAKALAELVKPFVQNRP